MVEEINKLFCEGEDADTVDKILNAVECCPSPSDILAGSFPSEPNIIVFDDIVTTGSTLASIKNAFAELHKNLIFFTGINNKL